MTVYEAIRQRRSIRSYAEKPVAEEKLLQVLQAGQLAPSARNQQHWKFVVVTDPKLRERLAQACCGQRDVAQAPVDLVVCATQMRQMTCGQTAETVDCSIALSFMMLQAAELGLGTCWLGAFENEKVKSALSLPDDYTVIAVSPLGYPQERPESRPRLELEDIVIRK